MQTELAIFEQSSNQVLLPISALYPSTSRFHSLTPLFHDPSNTATPLHVQESANDRLPISSLPSM
jgi:hypothetical protein